MRKQKQIRAVKIVFGCTMTTALVASLAIMPMKGLSYTRSMAVVMAADKATDEVIEQAETRFIQTDISFDKIKTTSSFESDNPVQETSVEDQKTEQAKIESGVSMSSDFNAAKQNSELKEKLTKMRSDVIAQSKEQKEEQEKTFGKYESGKKNLTATGGTYEGPSGKETYYNLPMNGVISIMRRKGYSEQEYPYWIREDGVKMFGDYVMVAANLEVRPKGTILECSKGTAIVVDTGKFAETNETQLDIATNW